MKLYPLSLALLLLVIFTSSAVAQKTDPPKSNGDAKSEASTIPAPPPITDKSTPMELAKAALAAMGGDNFKKMKSSFVVGSANLYGPNQTQPIPGTFGIATAGDWRFKRRSCRLRFRSRPSGVFDAAADYGCHRPRD